MSIKTSDSIIAISKALLTFQGQVDGVGKTKKNPAFKSNYATLENVRDTAVPELQAVGVVFIQSAGAIVDGVMSMTTRLIHAESGEWIEGVMDIPLGKRDPQGMGSAQTYASRYGLMAMLGLPAIDDDSEAAIDRNNQRPAPTSTTAERANQPDTGLSAYNRHNNAMTAAKTLPELQAAFEATKGDRRLTNGECELLLSLKDRRKLALSIKPVFIPANFDSLDKDGTIPYADRDELQEALNNGGQQ